MAVFAVTYSFWYGAEYIVLKKLSYKKRVR